MGTQNVDNVNMEEKSYHHGNLRAALIEAALAALARSDTADALSLRAIAREVGVSANAAYRHFADKEALLNALAAEGFRRFAAHQAQTHAQAQRQHAAPKEVRAASGKAYVHFARDNPALFRLMFGRMVSQNIHDSANEELQQMGTFAFQGLLQATAQENGTPPDSEQTLLMAIARWGLVHGLSHLMLDGQLASFGSDVDQIIDGVFKLKLSEPEAHPGRPPSKARS
ncbi:MAG: TetR/AcrR family transcriptional regulator [Aquabacterium sp.]